MDRPGLVSRQALEDREDRLLAPYALRSSRSRRRIEVASEAESFQYRTAYQRDRDRIIHSRAFRRLKHKTQVYLPHREDHTRTRLTHTLEVVQLSRTIARALALNEDLTEAIALGHDLGHTPFGHSGEVALNRILSGQDPIEGIPEADLKTGRAFKHNIQSVRVVDLLEIRYEHDGLNLTDDVREGIAKHTSLAGADAYPEVHEGLYLDATPFFEAQIVALADEIAQQTHDLEDGLRHQAVELGEVESLSIVVEARARTSQADLDSAEAYRRRNAVIRNIIDYLITDIVNTSAQNLGAWSEEAGVKTADEFYAQRWDLPADRVALSSPVQKSFADLKRYIYRNIIGSAMVSRFDHRARHFIRQLFAMFYGDPRLLDDYALRRFAESEGFRYLRDVPVGAVPAEFARHYQGNARYLRMVCDHVASMTDRFALEEAERMLMPFPRN